MSRKIEMIVKNCNECPFNHYNIEGTECYHEDGVDGIYDYNGGMLSKQGFPDDCPLPKD